MADERRCAQCGAALPADAPQGLCPACLLKRGFATGSSVGASHQGARTEYVPPAPNELARYFPELEILELIGRGGMGAVYKARQKQLDRFVALKVLPFSVSRDPAFAERFVREAKALARLTHPHIVTVHDFGQKDGLFYFLMEFVDGLNLRQLLNSGKISPKEALAIVPQICAALQYAHDKGIVHRDIKPENILLAKDGTVKIADFGLAKLVGLEAKDQTITGVGDVMGTPHYMAPEQIEHPQDVDHRADIYSLGVVFYQMLTGELPLGRFAPPSKKVVIDVRLDEVVLRALEKEPEQRYQHVSEVKTQVETIAATAPVDAEALAEEILTRDYVLDTGSCLRRGWALVRNDFWPILGITTLIWLLLQLANSGLVGIAFGGPLKSLGKYGPYSLLGKVFGGPLMGGLQLYFLRKIRGQQAGLGTAFSGFSIAFPQLFLVYLVTAVLTVLGFVCLIVPGIYLWVSWMFALTLVIDKRLDFWPAMKLSRKTISKHWWKLFGFAIVLLLVKLAGILAFFVGFLVTIPVALAATMYAYEDIFGTAGRVVNKPMNGLPTRGTSRLALGKVAVFFGGLSGVLGIVTFYLAPQPPEILVWSILMSVLACLGLGVASRTTSLGKRAIVGGSVGAAIWLILFTAFNTFSEKKPLLSVTGRVTDAVTGAPILHARVDDNRYGVAPNKTPQQAWTDADGRYDLKTRPEEHTIAASAPGYESKLALLTTPLFSRKRVARMDFQLQPVIEQMPASAQELVTRLESALREHDTNKIYRLFNWQGVPDSLKASALKSFDPVIEHVSDENARLHVWLSPLPADAETEAFVNGIRYTPNIPPVGMIRADVSWAVNGSNTGRGVSMPYGKQGVGYYLVGTAAEKIYTPKTKEKGYFVHIQGIVSSDAAVFTGEYVYVQNGTKITKSITGTGSATKTFWGDCLESCLVQKTSGKRPIRLLIYEDGKQIFESPETQGNDPIIYKGTGECFSSSFGPVIEEVLKAPDRRVAELLDLDTGQRATITNFGANDRETHAWIRENHLDVSGVVEKGQIAVLCFDIAVVPTSSNRWDAVTPSEIATNWGLNQQEPKPITAISPVTDNTDTWFFRTREGTYGVLQILGPAEEPRGVKIRYKLVPR